MGHHMGNIGFSGIDLHGWHTVETGANNGFDYVREQAGSTNGKDHIKTIAGLTFQNGHLLMWEQLAKQDNIGTNHTLALRTLGDQGFEVSVVFNGFAIITGSTHQAMDVAVNVHHIATTGLVVKTIHILGEHPNTLEGALHFSNDLMAPIKGGATTGLFNSGNMFPGNIGPLYQHVPG